MLGKDRDREKGKSAEGGMKRSRRNNVSQQTRGQGANNWTAKQIVRSFHVALIT